MTEIITPEKQVKFYQAFEQAMNDLYDHAYNENNIYIDEVERIVVSNLRKHFHDTDCSQIIGRSNRHMRQKHGSRKLFQDKGDLPKYFNKESPCEASRRHGSNSCNELLDKKRKSEY